jgi:serine/threonine-protein kinase
VGQDLRQSLQQALGPAYVLERELGGGMSRVFVATEASLGRRVVLKVLPPSLAAGLSVDRFRREIQVAASLQHPHIVPLLTAGQAGEFLYYTMPLVEGESLRARLDGHGELPVTVAARWLGQIARALAYAHRHGIVHRDIKPDNILLSGDEVQVADFGIAKALAESVQHAGITSVGLAIGTPAYMAPEQAVADPAVDHRADLYALGVVGYEMLAGQPPFAARTAPQLLAAHATERPVPLRERRPAVPAAIADVVMALLEKRPADRPQSAEEVAKAIEAGATPVPGPATAKLPAATSRSHGGRWVVAGGIGGVVLITLLASLSRRDRPAAVDRQVVAVAPFRVSGADSSLAYLHEGMVDLLAAKLSGTAGLRPADPRTLAGDSRADADERDVLARAMRAGAGRVVQGEVVGNRRQVTITAALLDAPSGKAAVRASVEGPADSLTRLVDRLAAKLLALGAGESEQRLAALTSTSLDALRAYLDGEVLLRRGRFQGALDKFDLALQVDSTFALAGLGLIRAGEWLGKGYFGRGAEVAWGHRDRLTPRDRAHLEVFLGPKYPAARTFPDGIAAAERFTAVAPDSPEAWYLLGDQFYHFGAVAGVSASLPRANEAWRRALGLDAAYVPALEHSPQLAYELGDTAGVRRALSAYLKLDSTSSWAAHHRWYVAAALGDTTAERALARDDSVADGLGGALGAVIEQGVGAASYLTMLPRYRLQAITERQREGRAYVSYAALLAAGRPREAAALLESLPEKNRWATALVDLLTADGDSAAGTRAAVALEGRGAEPVVVTEAKGPSLLAPVTRWARGQYALEHGRPEAARRMVAQLRAARVPADSGWASDDPAPYALALEAQLAAASRDSVRAGAALRQLDSALVNSTAGSAPIIGNLLSARIHEQRGELPAALAALRRRVFDLLWAPAYAVYHRQEGRLAALTGDREGAIRAYRRYLALRADPEPRLRPQRDRVVAELGALEREPTDR